MEKGRKWRFLTDLCFSWFKMDPACPSYHCWLTFSPRTLFRRRTLGLAVRKVAKPPFFQIGTQNAHLECDFPPFWCGPPRKRLRRSHWGTPVALPGLSTLTGCREVPSFHFIHWIRLCTPFRPIFCLATTAKHVRKQNGRSAIEPLPPTQTKFL